MKEARRADRFTQLALVAGDEALAQAGLDDGYDGEDVGCVIGTGIGGIGTIEDQHDMLRERGAEAVSPLAVPLMMANAASGVLAMKHGLRGECYGTVSACAAGAHAVGTGLRMVRNGDAEACRGRRLRGGRHAAVGGRLRGHGRHVAEPAISRPFDRRRDGFVMGEGAGVLVLEDEERARERGAEVLGRAHRLRRHRRRAPPDRARAGRRRARRGRWRAPCATPGLEPGDVDWVNAHGTSTPLNDRSETEAIKRALGEPRWRGPGLVAQVRDRPPARRRGRGRGGGHRARAARARSRRRPLGWEERDEGLDLDYVPGESRPLERNGRPRRAISNSFGFGGHNAVLCLEAARERRSPSSDRRAERSARAAASGSSGSATRAPCASFARRSPRGAERTNVPGDGVVAAAGTLGGRPLFCYSQDRSVLGGSLGEAHAETRSCACCAWPATPARRWSASSSPPARAWTRAAPGWAATAASSASTCACPARVPQITVITGSSAGGGSYSPALTDFVVMTEGSSMFLTGPGVVDEVMGEDVSKDELGGPRVHSRNGVCQLVAARRRGRGRARARPARPTCRRGGRPGRRAGRRARAARGRPRGESVPDGPARSTTCAT